jgi:hypothetical protein
MAACAAVADQVPGGERVRGKGITYDTGFFRPGAVTGTRDVFDPQVVRREMEVIREDLHCNAVRVTGGRPGAAGGRRPARRRGRPGGLVVAVHL